MNRGGDDVENDFQVVTTTTTTNNNNKHLGTHKIKDNQINK